MNTERILDALDRDAEWMIKIHGEPRMCQGSFGPNNHPEPTERWEPTGHCFIGALEANFLDGVTGEAYLREDFGEYYGITRDQISQIIGINDNHYRFWDYLFTPITDTERAELIYALVASGVFEEMLDDWMNLDD